MAKSPVRLGLVGAGGHCSGNHLPAMRLLAQEQPDAVELVAVCDLDREKAESARREYGFARAYTDMHEMMKTEAPDGCVVIMRVPLIVPVALELLQYKIPLTVEKPPGRNAEETEQLCRAAAEAGVSVQVSVNRRFNPFIMQGLKWAREQGPISYVEGMLLRANRREPEFMWSTGIHALDTLCHLGGEVTSFSLRGGKGAKHGVLWGVVDLEFENGAHGVLHYQPDCGMNAERYIMRGEEFSVEIETGRGPLSGLRCCRNGEDVICESFPADTPGPVSGGPYGETLAFVEAIRDGRPLSPSPQDVLRSVKLTHAIHEEAMARYA